jgi:hypothetical protein
MSASRLRARLERLERAAKAKKEDGSYIFPIDPPIARSVRDDWNRQYYLGRKQDSPSAYGPTTAADLEERERRWTSIYERLKTISIADGYTPQQKYRDYCRLRGLWDPVGNRAPLSGAEDAEEAQLRARILAYEYHEHFGRKRIGELEQKANADGLTPAEENELDRLRVNYPPVDLTKDPNYLLAWRRMASGG